MPIAEAESVSWLRFTFASVTVISLMALLGWGLKYVTMRSNASVGKRGLGKWLGLAADPNAPIRILSSFPIDARRKLVIAKCDDIEYHLLLGPNNDVVLSRKFHCPPSATEPSDSCSTAV